jgi:hypothetical protein
LAYAQYTPGFGIIYSLYSRLYSRLPDASRESDFWELVEAQEKRGSTGPLKDPL